MVIFTIFVILLFDVNTGNVICLPKSGSTFVNALLGKHSLHEYDHQGISNLAIEMSSMPSEAIALYYLSTRREYISNYVDISTTMIFLIDYFSKTDYSLPTLFILRNPRDWCRSILSYSLDVARAGEYHDWVQNYQSLFTGGVHISARDLANDTSLALKINALLPGLFRCWHNSHSRLASNIHKFGNLYMLNTNNLSNNCSNICQLFAVDHQQIDLDNTIAFNCSTKSNIIREMCDSYFKNLQDAPSSINHDSLSTYLTTVKDHKSI
ncbi:hypothetical protein PMIT1327_00055 [Prochlorococcus marinus str. MIT 1327]|nr:hypothetical protein PMIT1312_00052 [Prochlorococcus marinus str. MIT 1312]KZR84582.1 hypothetical protein PMIT1327_00055 [Prochlorococcus marinus str. MIT 1327]